MPFFTFDDNGTRLPSKRAFFNECKNIKNKMQNQKKKKKLTLFFNSV